MRLATFLHKDFTKYQQENAAWKNGLFHAIGILMIFLLFQPFGFRDKEVQLKWLLFPGFASIAFLYSVAKFYIIRKTLRTKKTWTVKNELVSFFFSLFPLVLIIHLYSYWAAGDMPLTIHWYIKLFYYTTSLFIIAYAIEFLFYSNQSAGIRIEDLSSQMERYSKQIATAGIENTNETIPLLLEKGRLPVNREKLVFIESKGNYVELHLRNGNGETVTLTKRGRLHQVETDLANYLEFFRCHRAFIVNLKRTQHIKGNSKNAQLILDDQQKAIPVSRTYFKTLTQKLEQITAQ